jgi:TPP-dependent pyruvate/acetoin dehydrogenase alpha subunit
MKKMTKEEMIEFEAKVARLWEEAKIPYPVHFCGGNEDQLIEIFKEIQKGDCIFSTHRSHYHYLLAGGDPAKLEQMILAGDSMHVFDRSMNFFTSAIVSGCPGIAAGTAWAIKRKGEKNRVWCFVGDGAEDEGHFYEAVRYVEGHDLPCTFIIEDNDRSVETPKAVRYGRSEISWPKCVRRYHYTATYPHVGTGTWINFSNVKAGGNSF